MRATEEFLYFEVFDRSADPIAHSEAVIAACERGAGEFQRALLSNAFKGTDAAVYAAFLINEHFQDTRLECQDPLHSLSGILTSFLSACAIARQALEESASFSEGTSWAKWVRRLTQIAKEEGLPWQVRKDKSGNERQSPFVLFLWEVQETLPAGSRRSSHSKGALADAINHARTSGLKKVIPHAE